MGNCNGVIAYGLGKGHDFEAALNDSIRQAKKNLIALNLDHFFSFPAPIVTNYNGFKLEINPRDEMNSWGHPNLAYFFALSGVTNVSFKLTSRNISNYAMVYTFFKAMTKIASPKQLSEQHGEKIYRNEYLPFKYAEEESMNYG